MARTCAAGVSFPCVRADSRVCDGVPRGVENVARDAANPSVFPLLCQVPNNRHDASQAPQNVKKTHENKRIRQNVVRGPRFAVTQGARTPCLALK